MPFDLIKIVGTSSTLFSSSKNEVMPEDLKTNEKCECEDNQEVHRQTIEVAVKNDSTLSITESRGPIRQSEEVTSGSTSTFTGRSYDELLKLGTGRHSICKCRTIGPADAIYRPSDAKKND